MTPFSRYLHAIQQGDVDTVRRLLDADPMIVSAVDEEGKTGLHWAAESDQGDIARLLLDAGADREARTSWGATPLDWAAVMGGVRVGQALIDGGATGLTLVVASGLGLGDRVREILDADEPLDAHRRRGAPDAPDEYWPADSAHVQGDVLSDALYAAARIGHTEVVRQLLDRGASVDAVGVFGATALHWAALHGHEETALLLVERGARRDRRDPRFDATPAGWAAEGGHEALAERLKDA